ncbi:Imm26 family immunity protein [Neobacillus niacini]|uniref:Imm26 family immunity protein n=1 Tax=Neobacillus niacini TaxID=86668 RepID=UPI0005EE00C2|nr:Imm26 family immunity protein [Neobacillus niacini]
MEVKIGVLSIYFPDASSSDFFINEDLAEFLGFETSQEAAKYVKKKLKDKMEWSIKKVKIDYETNGIFIASKKGEVIVEAAILINELINFEISKTDIIEVIEVVRNFKRPKKQKWTVGDIFYVPLSNGSFSYGQIIKDNDGFSTCCLFKMNSNEIKDINSIITTNIVAVLPISPNSLDNHNWKIIGSTEVRINVEEVVKGQPKKYKRRITQSTFPDESLRNLSEAIIGIRPWNENVDEEYYDKMLLPDFTKPKSLLYLTRDEKINRFKEMGYDLNELENAFNKTPDFY